MESVSTNGWILGAKVGAEYSIDENNAVEFGLKTDRTKYRAIDDAKNRRDKPRSLYGIYI